MSCIKCSISIGRPGGISILRNDRHRPEVAELFARWEQERGRPCSALFSLLGHKGDLLFLHFRDDFKDLNRAELELSQTGFSDFLKPSHSYLSMVELGLYESSAKTYESLAEKGFHPGTPEWEAGVREVLDRQATAMEQRLKPAIPDRSTSAFTRWIASALRR